jgi:hypothetical protein
MLENRIVRETYTLFDVSQDRSPMRLTSAKGLTGFEASRLMMHD